MPKIMVTARFYIEFRKDITTAQLRQLWGGASILDIVDESEAYRQLSFDGDVEMEWEPIDEVKPKKKSKKRSKKKR